jgi:hypothetical protein
MALVSRSAHLMCILDGRVRTTTDAQTVQRVFIVFLRGFYLNLRIVCLLFLFLGLGEVIFLGF